MAPHDRTGGRREESAPYHVRRRRSKEARKAAILAYLARHGHEVGAVRRAYESAGVIKRTYDRYRQEDRHFDLQCALATGRADGAELPGMDFVHFRKTYFERETPLHHGLMIEAIETAPLDSITMILAPPEAAKTSLVVDLICWKLANDPNYRIAVVSESQTLARKIIGQVSRRMTDHGTFGLFIDNYGPFRAEERSEGKPWNADALYLLRAGHDEKEPSLEARGATGQIYGARYDLLILDDIQSRSNLGETDKLIENFRQDMLSRVSAEKGKTIIVGTRVEQHDFYERLLDENEGTLVDRLVQIRALTDEGQSYWPEWWPLERLERRRDRVGPSAWARAYMQHPQASGNPTFTEEMLKKAHDPAMSMGGLPRSVPWERVVCAVDPALSGITALVALAYNATHCWLIDVETWEGMGRTEEILARMGTMSAKYRPSHWVVEINAYQGSLARDERLAQMGRAYNFEVVSHATARNKADPILGIGSMASAWSLGEITVPYGDGSSRAKADAFDRELLNWRPGVPGKLLRQDQAMAFWFAWRHWMGQRRFFTPQIRKEWRPTWAA